MGKTVREKVFDLKMIESVNETMNPINDLTTNIYEELADGCLEATVDNIDKLMEVLTQLREDLLD